MPVLILTKLSPAKNREAVYPGEIEEEIMEALEIVASMDSAAKVYCDWWEYYRHFEGKSELDFYIRHPRPLSGAGRDAGSAKRRRRYQR
jgi:hypothetical protein